MDQRGARALALAVAYGFEVELTDELAAVYVVGSALRIGPLASPDCVATAACRRALALRGAYTEDQLADAVAALGYVYEPEPGIAGDA